MGMLEDAVPFGKLSLKPPGYEKRTLKGVSFREVDADTRVYYLLNDEMFDNSGFFAAFVEIVLLRSGRRGCAAFHGAARLRRSRQHRG